MDHNSPIFLLKIKGIIEQKVILIGAAFLSFSFTISLSPFCYKSVNKLRSANNKIDIIWGEYWKYYFIIAYVNVKQHSNDILQCYRNDVYAQRILRKLDMAVLWLKSIISQMTTAGANIIIAIKLEIVYDLSIGIFTFDRCSF